MRRFDPHFKRIRPQARVFGVPLRSLLSGVLSIGLSGCASGGLESTTVGITGSLITGATYQSQTVREIEEERQARQSHLERRAERDLDAAVALAAETGNLTYLERLAADGNAEAKHLLELRQRAGQDVWAAAQWARGTGDLTYLETLEADGHARATGELDELVGTAKAAADHASRTRDLKPLERLVERGNLDAYFALYQNLSIDRERLKTAWTYLCHAANKGHVGARVEVGWWHMEGDRDGGDEEKLRWLQEDLNIQPDDRVAIMWYFLSEPPYVSPSEKYRWPAERLRLHWLAGGANFWIHTTGESESLARRWKPGECPSAEHRLDSPGSVKGAVGTSTGMDATSRLPSQSGSNAIIDSPDRDCRYVGGIRRCDSGSTRRLETTEDTGIAVAAAASGGKTSADGRASAGQRETQPLSPPRYLRVAILPPATRGGSGWTASEWTKFGRDFVNSKSDLTLAYYYDAYLSEMDLGIEPHEIWEGQVHKMPRKSDVYALKENLDVDVALAFYLAPRVAGHYSRDRYNIEIYIFDLELERAYRGSSDELHYKQLMERLYDELMRGRQISRGKGT